MISRLKEVYNLLQSATATERMPSLFVGHGNPMNAIEDNDFSQTWRELGKALPKPKAILSVSAHWLTRGGTAVTVMPRPRTIHDFGGFPRELFAQQYPAPGSPEWARETMGLVTQTQVQPDEKWGLDHGTWSVLLPMYPEADIPVPAPLSQPAQDGQLLGKSGPVFQSIKPQESVPHGPYADVHEFPRYFHRYD